MSENRVSEGELVTLEGATAASNIAAGCMVGVGTGVNLVYSLDREAAGFTGTALAGGRFVGVLDESISAGQSPVTVWTNGVFKFRLNTGSTLSASAMIGKPVYAQNSGGGTLVDTTAVTGDIAVGTIVGRAIITEPSCTWVRVKITPGIFRWGIYGQAAAGALSGTSYVGHVYPPLT